MKYEEKTYPIANLLNFASKEQNPNYPSTYILGNFFAYANMASLEIYNPKEHGKQNMVTFTLYCKDEYKEGSICRAQTFASIPLREVFTPDELLNNFWTESSLKQSYLEDYIINKDKVCLIFQSQEENGHSTMVFLNFQVLRPFFTVGCFFS